jgi:thiamine-phosphate pyrophosphorylase
MVGRARAIKAALRPSSVPFVVNDRIDVALAAGADGVHIGPDDMTAEDARRSARARCDHRAVDQDGCGGQSGAGRAYRLCRNRRRLCDIIERAKERADRPGRIRRVADALHHRAPKLPVAGIAGIDAGNAAAVIGAGADGVAVISALSLAPDPPRPRVPCAKSSTESVEAGHVMLACSTVA